MNEDKTFMHIKIEDVVCQNIQTNNFARLQLEVQTVKHESGTMGKTLWAEEA